MSRSFIRISIIRSLLKSSQINLKSILICLQQTKAFMTFYILFILTTLSSIYSQTVNYTGTPRLLGSYLATDSRQKTLTESCGSETRRTLTSTELSAYVNTVNSSIGLDGTSLIRQAAKVNFESAETKVRNNSTDYQVFILTFGMGLVILLLSFPFLICCCTCNSCCPPKGCHRKPQGHQFQRYDMLCPLLSIIALFTMITAVAIYGLIQVSNNSKSYQQSSCAAAIFTDDIMNGNETNSGDTFFIGLNSFPVYLDYLKGNLTSIDGNLSDIYSSSTSSIMNQAISGAQTAKNDTIKISNNDAAGSSLTLTYNTPIDTTTSTGSISSRFPTVLGSYSSQTGLVWSLYSTIYQFQQFLTKFKGNTSNLHSNLTLFRQGLSQGVSSANDLKKNVKSDINDVNKFIQSWSRQSKKYEPIMLGYFLGVIGILIVCLMAVIFAYRGNKNCCRRFMYLNCVIMFFLCLLGFLVATGVSAFLPIYAWGCNYLDQSVSNQYNYQNNLNFWIDIKTLQQTGVCMPYGNGDIYTQLAGTTGSQQFDILRGIFTTLTTFQLSSYMTPIYKSLNSTLNTVQSYGLGQLIDLNDSTSVSTLQVLADYSKGSYTNCNSNTRADSWVPSNNQASSSNTIISCTATNGNQGTASSCPSGLSSTSGGCSGCMDSSELLFRYLNPAHSLPTDLSLRYGSICSFNTKLNNVWTKYYKIKLTAIGPTVGSTTRPSGVYPRAKTVETDIKNLNTTVNPALTNTISTINNNLQSISSLTDPIYGIFGSVNCKVMGEDVLRVRGTLCGSAFSHTYIMRIILGTLAYLIQIALFLIVVFGSRHARSNLETEQLTYHPDVVPTPFWTGEENNKKITTAPWNINSESEAKIVYL